MKKYINGKKYDTDTAKRIGEDSYSNRSDFDFWEETLYQKRTGEFFLMGEGGACSKYAEYVGQNSWCGGNKIIPLSFESAREWVERHLDADQYEALFGALEETDERQPVTFSLPTDAIDGLKRMAAQTGKSQSVIITELIRNSL